MEFKTFEHSILIKKEPEHPLVSEAKCLMDQGFMDYFGVERVRQTTLIPGFVSGCLSLSGHDVEFTYTIKKPIMQNQVKQRP